MSFVERLLELLHLVTGEDRPAAAVVVVEVVVIV